MYFDQILPLKDVKPLKWHFFVSYFIKSYLFGLSGISWHASRTDKRSRSSSDARRLEDGRGCFEGASVDKQGPWCLNSTVSVQSAKNIRKVRRGEGHELLYPEYSAWKCVCLAWSEWSCKNDNPAHDGRFIGADEGEDISTRKGHEWSEISDWGVQARRIVRSIWRVSSKSDREGASEAVRGRSRGQVEGHRQGCGEACRFRTLRWRFGQSCQLTERWDEEEDEPGFGANWLTFLLF